jgi:NAD(P)-dependent dehydrogenase (short-subunit alcohol dehydrogenase family)
MELLLRDKSAVVYGAGGKVGGAVARNFAREGAHVFLTGRTREKPDAVAEDITAEGGSAEVAVVDALDERAVEEHARAVVSQAGSIDVSFDLISRGDVQGIPLVEMTADDLLRVVVNGLHSNFLPARAGDDFRAVQLTPPRVSRSGLVCKDELLLSPRRS